MSGQLHASAGLTQYMGLTFCLISCWA